MKLPFNREKIFKTTRLIAKPVVAVTVAIILCTLFTNQITKISKDTSTAQTLSYTLQKRIEVISQMRTDMEKIGDANYAKLENALVSTDNVTDIIVAFDNLGRKNGINITPTLGNNLNPTSFEIKHGQKIVSIDYTISTSTTVNTFINFLKAFEKLTIMPVVVNLDINGPTSKGWNGTSSIVLRGKIYAKQN